MKGIIKELKILTSRIYVGIMRRGIPVWTKWNKDSI